MSQNQRPRGVAPKAAGRRYRKPAVKPAENVVGQVVIAPEASAPRIDDQPTTRHLSQRKFQDAPISPASKLGISHEFMTDVQAMTLELALSGADLLVQAKTGTGKTIAFLLPSIERLLSTRSETKGISILVLSPTRELALQIEEEASTLLKHHPYKVQHTIGGTNINAEKNRLAKERCNILIATPGRLLDHLQSNNLTDRFSHLKTLVFDEADRLLDQGFKRELDAILKFLPERLDVPRQTLLFSATVDEEVRKIAARALNPDYRFLSTLLPDEINTHESVDQSFIITPFASHLATIIAVLRNDMASHPTRSKAMVFFPTARHVGFAAALLALVPSLPPVYEIHSRKSQAARMKAADTFRDATSGILLSSDVVARGMDFPSVTLVIQAGLPASSEQYIHRLGRTARAGAAGQGILILAPAEESFLQAQVIRDLPLKPYSTSPSAAIMASIQGEVDRAFLLVPDEVKAATYRAWLGYYNSNTKTTRWSKERLVQEAFEFAVHALGWRDPNPPDLEPSTVGKMGLKGVVGLNIQKRRNREAPAIGGAADSRRPRGR